MERIVVGRCRVCGGPIVKKRWKKYVFDAGLGPVIIGPGAKEQYHKIEQVCIYCEKCGIKYAFAPLFSSC